VLQLAVPSLDESFGLVSFLLVGSCQEYQALDAFGQVGIIWIFPGDRFLVEHETSLGVPRSARYVDLINGLLTFFMTKPPIECPTRMMGV